MNFEKFYLQLISKRKSEILESGEMHHIIPKCLGGSNDGENLVRLTIKEHLFAHVLLYKMHPNNYKIIYAFCAMCMFTGRKSYERHIPSLKTLAKSRELLSKARKMRVGELNSTYDPTIFTFVNRKTKEEITMSRYNFCNFSGISLSAINHVIKSGQRFAKDWGIRLPDGSCSFDKKSNAGANRKGKFECPHCKMKLDWRNFSRWHGDKCSKIP